MAHVIERLEHPGAAAAWLDARRGKRIGFVPTMGALHAGHLSLVARARVENELVVVSVFVNPLQFDDAGDLAAYPRDLERDAELLAEAGCDLVFTGVLCGPGGFFPECAAAGEIPSVDPGPAALGLEGDVRAGHFEGVATIVRRLFETVRPARAYFGAKDFQQTLVVRHLAERMEEEALGSAPEIVVCAIVREPGGLARSSRNELLAPWTRAAAGALWRALGAGAECWAAGERGVESLTAEMRRSFASVAPVSFALEYLELRDPDRWGAESPAGSLERVVALIAARVPGERGGSVRLIDNLELAQAPVAVQPGPESLAEVHCLAPAKLNPQLRVLGKRSDGFHEVDLTMLAIDLVDHVTVRWIDDGVVRDGAALVEALTVGLSGPAASVDIPADGSNLAARAAGLVLGKLKGELPAGRVALHIDKRIPSRAGLGGGSSDAAAAFVGTLELVRLLELGGEHGAVGAVPLGLCARLAELGSDCAFFLEAAGLARCRGRGECVEPLDSKRHTGQLFTVVTPDIECPTGQVFGALEGGRADSSNAWHNDLEPAALRAVPALARFRDKLLELGGRWHLAGSGSSFFRVETQRPTPDELGDLAARAGALRYCGVHRLFGSGVRVEAVHGQAAGGGSSPQQSPEPTGAAVEESGR